MEKNINKKIYAKNHNSFFDKIIIKNRQKILDTILNYFKDIKINDTLDIGTTNDVENLSSNFIIKNLNICSNYKSISDQKIQDIFFSKSLKKSIIEKLTQNDLNDFCSDLVISNATIEHVGNLKNQSIMCENIINLSLKYFVIITPNRFHPIEFHSKMPFFHWLPKKIHRFILRFLGFEHLSKEENLNLLSSKDIKFLMNKLNIKKYVIKHIRFLYFKSNLILIGSKN